MKLFREPHVAPGASFCPLFVLIKGLSTVFSDNGPKGVRVNSCSQSMKHLAKKTNKNKDKRRCNAPVEVTTQSLLHQYGGDVRGRLP